MTVGTAISSEQVVTTEPGLQAGSSPHPPAKPQAGSCSQLSAMDQEAFRVDEVSALPDATEPVRGIVHAALVFAPARFDVLVVEADFEFEDAPGVASYALLEGEDVPVADINFDLFDRFRELRDAFRAVGHPLWARATVTINANGAARTTYDYLP